MHARHQHGINFPNHGDGTDHTHTEDTHYPSTHHSTSDLGPNTEEIRQQAESGVQGIEDATNSVGEYPYADAPEVIADYSGVNRDVHFPGKRVDGVAEALSAYKLWRVKLSRLDVTEVRRYTRELQQFYRDNPAAHVQDAKVGND